MDDFNVSSLIESKNEWCARLLNIVTPSLIEGIKSVFDEAFLICQTNDNEEKYLMTFQNLLNNIPKWSDEIVKTETDRIISSTGCNYLEDLLACVHIIQLKSLTCARVGITQKKIDINIPNIYQFIHKTYIILARKIYVNVYLFEKDIKPLEIQKNNRELELITKEAILNSIRESIPIESLLKKYLDESEETDVTVEEKREEVIDKEAIEHEREKTVAKIKEKLKSELPEKSEKNELQAIYKDININTSEESNVPLKNTSEESNVSLKNTSEINTHEIKPIDDKQIDVPINSDIDISKEIPISSDIDISKKIPTLDYKNDDTNDTNDTNDLKLEISNEEFDLDDDIKSITNDVDPDLFNNDIKFESSDISLDIEEL